MFIKNAKAVQEAQEKVTKVEMDKIAKNLEELGFDTHLSSEEALHRYREGFFIRAFVGYSGWAEGQLEHELKQQSWITRKAVPIAASLDADEHLWKELLSSMGPYYKMLASFPERPELN